MRLALAPKATGAEQAQADADEVEVAEVVGGARGDRRLDIIGSRIAHSRLISGNGGVRSKLRGNRSVLLFKSSYVKSTHRKKVEIKLRAILNNRS
jgi:hypothetical protein